jgi:hypothetical protein
MPTFGVASIALEYVQRADATVNNGMKKLQKNVREKRAREKWQPGRGAGSDFC